MSVVVAAADDEVVPVPDCGEDVDDDDWLASFFEVVCLLIRHNASGVLTGDEETGIFKDFVTNSVMDDEG